MKFTAIISAIITFIRYIPDLIKIFREITGLLQEYQDKSEAKDKANQVAEAIKKAKETKDTGDLEKMFGKSFQINFVVPETEEKKSLQLGLLKFDVTLEERKRLADKIAELEKQQVEVPDLKKIEALVNETSEAEVLPEEIAPPEAPKKSFSFFPFSRSGSVIEGASFISNVRMSGDPRMSSKFFVFALLCLTLMSCKTGAKNEPSYQPKLYAGDSSRGGLYRKQSGELIRASDSRMDDMVAMSYSSLACIHKTYIANCREYKEQVVQCDGANVEFVRDLIKSK